MNHSMSYGFDIFKICQNAIFRIKKGIYNSLDTDRMVFDRHFSLHLFLSSCLMLETSHFHSDSLHETFGKQIINLLILHIKKLILKG